MARARALRGVSIPGLPGVLIGASNDVAWGATVSNADQSDWVVVEVDPADPTRYLTPDGYEAFATRSAEIAVAGSAPERVETRTTRWGPVVAEDWLGRPLALHATWLEPQGLDLDIVGLAAATDVASASAILARWAGPSLNWVLADRARRHRLGRQRPAAAPRRLRRLAARVARRRQPRVARPAAAAGRARRPRRRAVHGQQPHAAARRADAVSRMWMRPLRAKRIDDLLAAQPHFRRARLPRDAARHARRGLRADSRDDPRRRAADEREPLLQRARELAQAWNGTRRRRSACVSHAARVLPRAARAHARAVARARDRRRSRLRLPLAARRRSAAAAARRAARASLDERARGLAGVPTAVLLDTLDELERDGAARRRVGRSQRARRRASVRRRPWAARAPARVAARAVAGLDGVAARGGAELRRRAAHGRRSGRARGRRARSSRAARAAISCRRTSATAKRIGSTARRRCFSPASPSRASRCSRSASETRRARSSAAPRRRSAGARPRSRRRRRPPSSLGPRAARRRRAAPTPSCRCS